MAINTKRKYLYFVGGRVSIKLSPSPMQTVGGLNFSFASHPFHNYSLPSVPNLPHTPSPSPHTCDWWHFLPHIMFIVGWLSLHRTILFYLTQHILLDFPSVTSMASLPFIRLWHRPPPEWPNLSDYTGLYFFIHTSIAHWIENPLRRTSGHNYIYISHFSTRKNLRFNFKSFF